MLSFLFNSPTLTPDRKGRLLLLQRCRRAKKLWEIHQRPTILLSTFVVSVKMMHFRFAKSGGESRSFLLLRRRHREMARKFSRLSQPEKRGEGGRFLIKSALCAELGEVLLLTFFPGSPQPTFFSSLHRPLFPSAPPTNFTTILFIMRPTEKVPLSRWSLTETKRVKLNQTLLHHTIFGGFGGFLLPTNLQS